MSETLPGENFRANYEVSTSIEESCKKVFDGSFCNLCNVPLSGGMKNFQGHINGAKHRKNLKSETMKSTKIERKTLNKKKMNDNPNSSSKKTEKEAKPIKSLSLKRNPRTKFARQDYGFQNYNYDYNNYSQSNFYNDKRGRGNWLNFNQNQWYDGDYSGNYENRSYKHFDGSQFNFYHEQQCYVSESMEQCQMRRHDSVNKLDHLSPLEKFKTVKDINKISENDSQTTLASDSVSTNPINTDYDKKNISKENTDKDSRSFKKADDLVSQYKVATNKDNIAPVSTAEISSECDKQLDKKTSSENMTERISHWINPSSLKDKAEVDKLMTEYSKSRKKENLLRLKLHGEHSKSECDDKYNNSIEPRYQTGEHFESLQSPLIPTSAHFDKEENKSHKISDDINVSPKKVSDSNCSEKQTITKSPKVRKRKKSSLSESGLNSKDMNSDTIVPYSKSPVPRSSSLNRNGTDVCKKGRRARSSFDSSFAAEDEVVYDTHLEYDYTGLRKRKNSFQQINKSKKHKCSALECLEKCIHEERERLQMSNSTVENSSVYSDIYINEEELNLKKETLENIRQVANKQDDVSNPKSSEININNSQILDVEDLMKMFAAQNVKIKKEFDDPLIDAIQSMDVNLLFNVCDQQSPGSKEKNKNPQSVQSQVSVRESSDLATQPAVTDCNQGGSSLFPNSDKSTEKSSSIFHGMENQKLSDSSSFPSSNSVPESSLVGCDVVKDTSSDSSLLPVSKNNSIQSSDSFETIFPGLSPINVYVNISNELKKLQKEEEEKRANLKNIEKKIELHQKILNDLNAAKIKLQTEEDNLISRRNKLTCALSHCISRDSVTVPSKIEKCLTTSSSTKNTELLPSETKNVINETNQISTITATETISLQRNSVEIINSEYQCDIQMLSQKDLLAEDNEEVVIIPKEPTIVEIPVIDLVELESPEKQRETSNKENESTSSKDHLYEIKDFTAHKTVVNSLKVLNQYLYTCANDYTAKRFNLKNLEETVTYKHKKRNVLKLCVEVYKDTTIVFTLCSLDKFISLFKADDGLPLKKYSFEFVAASITNGWGKVFAGLNNGQVVVCNSNETKDLVRNLEPVKSMACTYQGGLHILIILSVNGQVAVRDVERNGLLIRYVKAHNDTPLFMNVYNDFVYLSSSLLLTVTDLTNGILKHKIKLTTPITGLAAHDSNIFTTSFSGLIRCYPNGQAEKMKMAYGVGNSVTSICVSQGWVITANRNGEIGAFKFDPIPEFHCEFSNCKNVFTRKEDLNRHLLGGIDHQISNKPVCRCPWRRCEQQFTKDWKAKDRKNHLENHVNTLPEGTDYS